MMVAVPVLGAPPDQTASASSQPHEKKDKKVHKKVPVDLWDLLQMQSPESRRAPSRPLPGFHYGISLEGSPKKDDG